MPVGYGIKKLQIMCVVEDDKVKFHFFLVCTVSTTLLSLSLSVAVNCDNGVQIGNILDYILLIALICIVFCIVVQIIRNIIWC